MGTPHFLFVRDTPAPPQNGYFSFQDPPPHGANVLPCWAIPNRKEEKSPKIASPEKKKKENSATVSPTKASKRCRERTPDASRSKLPKLPRFGPAASHLEGRPHIFHRGGPKFGPFKGKHIGEKCMVFL